jgi:starch phosphorylase
MDARTPSASSLSYRFLPAEMVEGFDALAELALDQHWPAIRFGNVGVETWGEQHDFEVQVYFDDLDPQAARVELFAEGLEGDAQVRQEMTRVRPLVGVIGGYVYRANVPADRPATDDTPRLIPCCGGAAVPLETAHILWQR